MRISISKRVSQRTNVIRRCLGLSVVGIALNLGAVSAVQAATDCNAVTEISPAECYSLLEFYNSTDGANWKYNEGWNVTDTPCRWYGITCLNGGVGKIVLQDNQLTGTISDFSALPNLEVLWLYKNQLTGTIPDFSTLPKLKELWFHKNQLTGTIPNFSALSNLETLYLHDNQLTGTIPNFNTLPHLVLLYLRNNQLTGTIPNFSGLPNLESLSLSSNQLTGTIPDFSGLPNLESLSLGGNQLCKAPDTDYSPWQSKVDSYPDCPKSQHTLTIDKTGEGEGNITGNGINCDNDCIKEYLENTSITLTATPNANSVFEGWSGACSGTRNCQVTLTADQNVTAIFNLKDYQLTVSKQGTGTGSVTGNGINCGSDCSEDYKANTSVTLIATSTAESLFDAWGGACSGTGNCIVTMNQAQNVIATFEPKPVDTFLLTISEKGNGNGTVTSSLSGINCGSGGSDCSVDFKANTSVTLTAKADAGSIFTGWNGADCSSDAATCVLEMNSDKTVTTKFDLCKYTVTPLKSSYGAEGGNGIIEVTAPIGCEWEAENYNRDWLKITASENSVVEYTVSVNEGSTERTGTLTIAGKTVTIEQGFENNEPPDALFTVTPLEGTGYLVVTVDASESSDPDGDPITYQWETSDGYTATEKVTDFTFEEVNSCEKTIKLTVTDDKGLSAQENKIVSLEDCAIVELQGLKEAYAVDERMTVKLFIDVRVLSNRRVDLWVAVQIPVNEWIEDEPPLLLFARGYGLNQFFIQQKRFNADYSFEVKKEEEYTLVDFTVPKGVGGTLIFYALYVDEDINPMQHLQNIDEIKRSELIIKQTVLANK